jgi:hypothetical protein
MLPAVEQVLPDDLHVPGGLAATPDVDPGDPGLLVRDPDRRRPCGRRRTGLPRADDEGAHEYPREQETDLGDHLACLLVDRPLSADEA